MSKILNVYNFGKEMYQFHIWSLDNAWLIADQVVKIAYTTNPINGAVSVLTRKLVIKVLNRFNFPVFLSTCINI